MKHSIDITKKALEQGFIIYTQTFKREDENIIGYIYSGESKLIVIKSQDFYYNRYIIALALSYYSEAEDKNNFYQDLNENIYDDFINQKAIDMLLPDRRFKEAFKRKRGNVIKLSQYFEVPVWVVEEKIRKENIEYLKTKTLRLFHR